jgi:hypothetical protein
VTVNLFSPEPRFPGGERGSNRGNHLDGEESSLRAKLPPLRKVNFLN